MHEPAGKIIRIRNRYPGPPTLAVNTCAEGLKKVLNLCTFCKHFKPREPDHCTIAQQLFDFSNNAGISTILYRCPQYVPKSGREVPMGQEDHS